MLSFCEAGWGARGSPSFVFWKRLNEDRALVLSVCYARYWETGTGDDYIGWVQVRLPGKWDFVASEIDLL